MWEAFEHTGGRAEKLPWHSHASMEDLWAGRVTRQDLVGNTVADVAAEVAAERSALPVAYLESQHNLFGAAYLIALRLSFIEMRYRRAASRYVPPPSLQAVPEVPRPHIK